MIKDKPNKEKKIETKYKPNKVEMMAFIAGTCVGTKKDVAEELKFFKHWYKVNYETKCLTKH